MGKSDAYSLKVVGNELWQDVGRHFLTSTLHWWVSRLTHIPLRAATSTSLTVNDEAREPLAKKISLTSPNDATSGRRQTRAQPQQPPTQQHFRLQNPARGRRAIPAPG